MNTYVVLIRGINVGGKNTVQMTTLKKCLEDLGFSSVITYIASGNVIVKSDKRADTIKTQIEEILPKKFKLDREVLKVLVLGKQQIRSVIDDKPHGFGDDPKKFHSDVIFLMGITAKEVFPLFKPNKDVDKIWPGDGVIYSQRLSALRVKSHLNRIMSTPAYQSMTIRNWNTTTKLLTLMKEVD